MHRVLIGFLLTFLLAGCVTRTTYSHNRNAIEKERTIWFWEKDFREPNCR